MRRKAPTISPYPETFSRGPEALERQVATERQIRNDEETLIWGVDDALPLRIIKAVDDSPTTISCLDEMRRFIQGSSFADEGLMNMVIDKDGTTLWDLHTQICEYMSLLDGFAVNFKYSREGRITNAYTMGLESCRFAKPEGKDIKQIKYNPYFGTNDYKAEYTTVYDTYNISKVMDGMKRDGNDYTGQIFFYGSERPMYKFYPMPKYWSGSKWIYVDGQIQEFHKNNLDNGFFQSVLMNVIGDPNQPSKNPAYQKYKTNDDGTKVPDGSSKTVGEEFSEQMSTQFSGVKKAGSVMTMWSKNLEESAKIQNFPTNTQFDVLNGTFMDAIRGITIATGVPAILANLPQQESSLGSDGNAINSSIELMQARVSGKQRILENFYNNILLPNFIKPTSARVQIKNYVPISVQVSIDDKFWDFMDDEEKVEFINENVPNVRVKERITTQEVTTPEEAAATDDILKGLNLRQIDKIGKIKARVKDGRTTMEEAIMILSGFGFTEEQISTFLQLNGEEV